MFAPRMTHTRRQQYRHRVRGAGYALSAAVISLFAVGAAQSGQDALTVFALLLLLVAALCWAAGRSQGLAERWRVGADSARAVQHALKELAGSGWVVRNGVRWPGGGDIDHIVRSHDGVGFAIETKTLTFCEAHLWRTAATARWAARSPATLSVRGRTGPLRRARVSARVALRRRGNRVARSPARGSQTRRPDREPLAAAGRTEGAGRFGASKHWVSLHCALELRAGTMVDETLSDERRRAPMGHREPERPLDDNPYIKLDGPTRRLFSDSELGPLASMLRQGLANEVVNRYVNEVLRGLPEYWIRKAGVYLPEVGSPLRYLAVGPTGAFIITPTNGRWTRDGLLELEGAARALDRVRPTHDFSPTRIRLVLAPNHPTLRPQGAWHPGRAPDLADQGRRAVRAPAHAPGRGAVSERSRPATHGAGGEAAGEQLRAAAARQPGLARRRCLLVGICVAPARAGRAAGDAMICEAGFYI